MESHSVSRFMGHLHLTWHFPDASRGLFLDNIYGLQLDETESLGPASPHDFCS